MANKTIFLLLTGLFFSLCLIAQSNFYISPNGNNSNTGSMIAPWKTIQYGIGQAGTNDTLNVLSGTYSEKININKSNLYLRNKANNTPILDGAGISSQNAMIQISNQSNITIEGLEIANNIQLDAQGILIDGAGSNLTIQHCLIHDIHFSSNPNAVVNANKNAQGIIVYGSDANTPITNLKINDNEIRDCRLGYSEGLAINGNVDGFEVKRNKVHDITNIGIDLIGHEGTCSNPSNDQARNGLIQGNLTYNCLSVYATSGGIYVDGGKYIVIEKNISWHNGYGIEIGCENIGKTTDNILVRDNIFYDNQISALALGGFDYPNRGKVITCRFSNNTCYKNNYNNDQNGEIVLTYSENCVIENNIFYLSAQNFLAAASISQPSLTFDYNLVYSDNSPANLGTNWNGMEYVSFAAFVANTGTNTYSNIGNPLFVDANITSPNFHILANSAAKEAGNPLFFTGLNETDIDGENRKAGLVDCGIDEYYANTSIEPALQTVLIYPNPVEDKMLVLGENIKGLSIYNQFGEKVREVVNNQATKVEIDLSELPSGLYFLQTNTGICAKIVKVK